MIELHTTSSENQPPYFPLSHLKWLVKFPARMIETKQNGKSQRGQMRRILTLLFVTLGVYFFMAHFAELDRAFLAAQKGNWFFILLSFVLMFAWQVNMAVSYKAIYHALGVEERLRDLVLAVTASFFSNVVAPAAGASALAVFIAQARHKEYSTARAALTFALFLEFEYISIMTFLGLGFLILTQNNQITGPEIGAAVIMAALTVGLAGLMILGIYSGHRFLSLFNNFTTVINRISQKILHRDIIDCQQATEFVLEIIHGLRALRRTPKRMLSPVLLSLSGKIIQLGILFMVVQAFQLNLPYETLVASFSLGLLFLIVSPTPYGIGVVEGVMILALISMHVDSDAAALITIVYRGFTFWLPLLVGFIAFRFLGNSFSKAVAAKN